MNEFMCNDYLIRQSPSNWITVCKGEETIFTVRYWRKLKPKDFVKLAKNLVCTGKLEVGRLK